MNFRDTLIPIKTDTYTPINHMDIIKGISSRIGKHRFTYSQNGKGTIVVGKFTLLRNNTINPQISFINSYNKRTKLGIITGAETFVCTNGMAIGDLVQLRKHTGKIDLDLLIETGISNIESSYSQTIDLMEQWKYIKMNKKDMAELTGRLFIEDRILNSVELNLLRKEIQSPTYQYDSPNDSLYSFYQHCTHAIKGVSPNRYVKTHSKIKERLELTYQ